MRWTMGWVLLLMACATEHELVVPERTARTVDSTGGDLQSADGLVTLAIPAGALTEPTEITITVLRDRAIPGLLSPLYELAPQGLVLSAPASFTLELEAEVDDVVLADADGTEPEIVADSEFDAEAGWVEGSLTTLSTYGAFEGESEAECPNPEDPKVEYISQDYSECLAALFQCDEGETTFDLEECGCGCIAP